MGLAPYLTCHDDFIPVQQELPGLAVSQLYGPCAPPRQLQHAAEALWLLHSKKRKKLSRALTSQYLHHGVYTTVSKARGRGEAWEGARDPTALRDPALVGITLEMSSNLGTLRALLTSFRTWGLGECWTNLPRPILPVPCPLWRLGLTQMPLCPPSTAPPCRPPSLGRDFPSKRA